MKQIVKEVLATPTAPLHEHRMMSLVMRKATAWGYRVKHSPKGNLLVGHTAAFRRPHVSVTAHMDHPGIRLLAIRGNDAEIGILGGVPQKLIRGSRWQLWDDTSTATGVVGTKTRRKWMGNPIYRMCLSRPLHSGAFGQLHCPSPQWKGNIVSSRAQDNVINVATLLALLQHERRNRNSRLLCLFTRAEEIGMVGACEAVSSRFLPKSAPIIVLEASSAKAGHVRLGGGPILRVGDRQSTFSPDVDLWLQTAARKFTIQRALMAGGTCEATLYHSQGYCAGSLALPLDNYHNNGGTRLAPEKIHWQDFMALQKFLIALLRTPFSPARYRHNIQQRFQKLYRRWESHLRL
jgi:endoglucanase